MANSIALDIQRLLTKSLGFDFDIIHQETASLTGPGEHYGSVMLAVTLKIQPTRNGCEEKTLNLVAKLLPANEMLRIAFDINVTFKKEVLAYCQAIPILVAFQKEFNVPEERSFDELFPKCFGGRISLDENSEKVDEDAVLVFENLKLQGFYTEDRLVGFDFEAAKVVLENLAKFHATPVALKLIKPKVFDEKIMPCLVKNAGLESISEDVVKSFHDAIMEGAREAPALEPHLPRLQEICDYFAVNSFVDRPPPKEPWGTMCHADFWVSNTMLLKDEGGTPVRNKIVDLQLMRYDSCTRDLVFFLFTSVINSVLDERFEDFLKIYHDSFIATLSDFGVDLKAFSWECFRKELEDVGRTEIYHVLVMLKPICTERDKIQNSAENFQDSDWSRKDLLGRNHRRKLKDTVLAFVKRGWL